MIKGTSGNWIGTYTVARRKIPEALAGGEESGAVHD
jgi:hypothetical protein